MESIIQKLLAIQIKLKAPKNQFNRFGNYSYRSCEDILEAVKPLLSETGILMTISDDVISINDDRVYVKATITITDGEKTIQTQAFAREAREQKGMGDAQITGSASSYARKYALNGMFNIDDSKDDDTRDNKTIQIKKESIQDENKYITKIEQKLIFDTATAEKVSIDTLKEYLKLNFGITSSTEIKKENFNQIMSWIKSKETI